MGIMKGNGRSGQVGVILIALGWGVWYDLGVLSLGNPPVLGHENLIGLKETHTFLVRAQDKKR